MSNNKDLVQLYDDHVLSSGARTKIYPKTKAEAVYMSTTQMLDEFLEKMEMELKKYSEDVVTSIPDIYQKILLLKQLLEDDESGQGLINKVGEIFVALPTFTKIYHMTEKEFLNLQKDQKAYSKFIREHLGWDIEIMEGEGSIGPIIPSEGDAVISEDGTVIIQGAVIDSNGVLTISKELFNKLFGE